MRAEGSREANRCARVTRRLSRPRSPLEAVKGDRSLAELATKYEVHPNQISQWEKALLAEMPDLFSDKRRKREKWAEDESVKLYEEIGRLKVERDWLRNIADELDG